MDTAANIFWQIWGWLNPVLWFTVGGIALRSGKRLPGILLLISATLGLIWQIIFFEGSPFTRGWETDSPLTISASYKLWGFLASNVLPAAQSILLLVAFYFAVRRPNLKQDAPQATHPLP